ncbi:MAG: hypothetical protein R2761_17570 [Acidimicrobiales bacterium]
MISKLVGNRSGRSVSPPPGAIRLRDYGIPDSWPHIRQLVIAAGFDGPTRSETVLAARCQDVVGHQIKRAELHRSVGVLGARFDLVGADGHLGSIEVGQIDQSLTRSKASLTWTDVGNVFATAPNSLDSNLPALMSAAAEWLM